MSDWRIVRIEWKAYEGETIKWYMFEFRVPESVTMEELEKLKIIDEPDVMKRTIQAVYQGECQHDVVTGDARPVSGSYGDWFDLEDVTELYGDKWTL